MARKTAGIQKAPETKSDPRVSMFLDDLERISTRDIIWKYITTGDPVMISREAYFDLRHKILLKFNLHPSSIVLVGSCKLGFSLKEKGHGPMRSRFQLAGDRNDVDVAVISQPLFDHLWDATFDLARKNRDWALDHGKLVARDLFNGWISPSEFPSYPNVPQVREWKEFFEGLSSARLCGFRKIEGRLYRSWNRLEAYQEIKVAECKKEIELRRD